MPITRPEATVELAWLIVVGLKPALRSRESACAAVSPSTLVTGALAGPPETTMPTRLPFSTRVPAAGVWLMTSPAGTVELGCREGTGFRPAWRSVAPAACSVWALTSGTVTLPAGESSSTAATATATASSPARPHHHRRRLRLCR